MIKTTVKAHTGSVGRGTYKVVTGTLVRWEARTLETGRHYVAEALIVDADGAEYRVTEGRIIETTHEVIEDAMEEQTAPEPKGIRFEQGRCGRCRGAGTRSDGGWAANNHGRCFRCNGKGVALTSNGHRAQEAYIKMRDDALSAKISELADGEPFWSDGNCYVKGSNRNYVAVGLYADGGIGTAFAFDAKVRRHDGKACREMWKVVAAKYKGATLVY